jgi:hypothetical protein
MKINTRNIWHSLRLFIIASPMYNTILFCFGFIALNKK